MKNKFTFGALIVAIFVGLFVLYNSNGVLVSTPGSLIVSEDREVRVLAINDVQLNVTMLTSTASRVQGLSGVEFLPEQTGYFFVFDNPGYHGIWMPDMLLDIDIIWLDKDLRVVHMAENISPDTYPEIFHSDKLALYVLEVNAGMAREWGMEIGSKLEWLD